MYSQNPQGKSLSQFICTGWRKITIQNSNVIQNIMVLHKPILLRLFWDPRKYWSFQVFLGTRPLLLAKNPSPLLFPFPSATNPQLLRDDSAEPDIRTKASLGLCPPSSIFYFNRKKNSLSMSKTPVIWS